MRTKDTTLSLVYIRNSRSTQCVCFRTIDIVDSNVIYARNDVAYTNAVEPTLHDLTIAALGATSAKTCKMFRVGRCIDNIV